MLTGLPALENTDWSRLFHAYGRATDTPDHLRALLEDDPAARREAIDHLSSAIIHQDTPWTATGPTAQVVAGLLSDERVDRVDGTRAALLSFLVGVAEIAVTAVARNWIPEIERNAAFDLEPFIELEDYDPIDDSETGSAFYDAIQDNEAAGNAFYARSFLGCIGAAPVIKTVMLNGLTDRHPRVRAVAAVGAVILTKSGMPDSEVADLGSRLLTLADAAADADERSAHVLALGELGSSPSAFLSDPSPAVRMCAALAPSLAAAPRAVDELLGALEKHAGEIDGWFVEKPLQFAMRPRFYVVARLIERVKDFDRLAPAAIGVALITEKFCIDHDWGPLLAAAFPKGGGLVDSDAQRRFLGALVGNAKLWDPTLGNASKWFKPAGLPYDRDACARLVKGHREVEP
jgi:hypothetical protein